MTRAITLSRAVLLCFALAVPCAAEAFTPKAYIRAVLDSSLTARRAEEAFKQAGNAYWTSFLDTVFPSFSLNASNSLYDDSDPVWRFRKKEVASSLSASWNLYDSASGPALRLKKARLERESAELAFLTARQNESMKALRQFYALFSAQKKVITARMNLASRERQYKDTNEQYQSGTRSRIETTQSEGDKLQSELSLAQAESAALKALIAFNDLLGADLETPRETEVSTRNAAVALPLPKDDLDRALENNFALRQQRIVFEKTRLAEREGIMADLPRLKLDAAWSKSSLGLFGTPGGAWHEDRTYGVGASLSFPFGFLGAQKYLDIKTRKSALRAADLELRDAVRRLKAGLLSAQKDIELQVKTRKLIEFQVKAQKEATENLLDEYSQGGASSLQLDAAQTKLLDASNNQIDAVNDLDLALADYMVLLGEKIWE